MGCTQFDCFLFSARSYDSFQHGIFNSVIKERSGKWFQRTWILGEALRAALVLPLLSCFCGFLSLSGPQTNGTLLATGSYDGFARIWTEDGEFCVPRAGVG